MNVEEWLHPPGREALLCLHPHYKQIPNTTCSISKSLLKMEYSFLLQYARLHLGFMIDIESKSTFNCYANEHYDRRLNEWKQM
ncbi:hypothetical protein Bca101_059748 [Brassica carinata]